ncbi:MAG: GntR family transcriptional regulator, partial [Miltoncostaeaceae bacterium]
MTAENLARVLGDWSAGSGPLYRRLHTALDAAIDRSELRHGTVLPTERSLADRLAISRTTVVRAYGDMKRAGLL